ncbi:NUDIX domain-containing protein [Silvimonas iriomotensis]|uniref:GDP-mannose pyrophosphatase n=1 Tax=Silvimonas iriomotensis TaxID=449662 RepID=A0ABQ2P903_9NEIS|nr:NUDIX hydrolase [Silvimonas iriomotensis]GGP21315.1 NUDIX domain-containing protein [Silvimonas iriomotensis]
MKDDQHLIETGIASERVFDGALLHINRDTVRLPDDSTATREYIQHPGAVMVIPVMDDGRLLMERQFRYPFKRVFLEFPAGKLDPNEDPLTCGKRELLEETGYTARHWRKLGVLHPIISYTSEEIHIFLAHGLEAGKAQLDEGEFLELVIKDQAELIAGIVDGSVTDGKTVAGMFWLEQLAKTGDLPGQPR